MAHFAQLDENDVVIQVIVVGNSTINDLPFPDSEPLGVDFCHSLFGSETKWVQTSYNNNFRIRYAGIGYKYDSQKDAFVRPQPYPSWVLNLTTLEWEAPKPYPTDGKDYIWDENTQEWILADEN